MAIVRVNGKTGRGFLRLGGQWRLGASRRGPGCNAVRNGDDACAIPRQRTGPYGGHRRPSDFHVLPDDRHRRSGERQTPESARGQHREEASGFSRCSDDAASQASSVGRNYDPTFDWSRLAEIREYWPKKLIIKGIVHPDDAVRAARLGVDAIVVSNHGGRQLDGGIATLDALPTVAAAVGDKLTVLVDGGIRRGRDVVKALALGARGVLIGRATLYGACAAGEAGARRAIEILQDELVRTMSLCGVTRIVDVGGNLVVREGADHHRSIHST
ncbi:MAG: alpha-hydroxy-acid oxidizing protein [Pseudomonadota bacterium]|nr:alpha-hydroxy-acid oxidizing protein [Pseudomonadota bacterium]